MSLPPVEIPSLQSDHLTPIHRSLSPWSKLSLPTLKLREFSLPRLSLSGILATGLLLLPVTLAIAAQPRTPNLKNQELVSAYLQDSGVPIAQAEPTATPTPVAQTNTTAQLASAPTLAASTGSETFQYHLSLAQGFLEKAVGRSQTSSAAQSDSDRQEILAFLQQALNSANTAIESDSKQGLGFLVRARIYKTASALKPELSPLAEQDLNIARALGITGDTTLTSPVDHLPTQQAQELANAPIIAEPEEGKTTSVTTQAQSNTQSGRAVMMRGNRTVDVSFPGLQPNMALRVDIQDPSQNVSNAVFTISSRTDGQGFTIQSTAPVGQDIALEWRAVTQ